MRSGIKAWDAPLSNVPEVDWGYQRRDLSHVDSEQRPKKPEYDRYLYLVDFYKRHNFDSTNIYENCPYKVLDIGIISILHQASRDLIHLCDAVSHNDGVDPIKKAWPGQSRPSPHCGPMTVAASLVETS